ncbi:MAG: very short patch repair endonuclease, partial [Dactylosporangium sp.]|nr:very short patch repair endonuclease [Dactylosporangium sp.]
RQRRTDTNPELAVRRLLHARGFRYRLHVPVPGLPRRSIDICFPRKKVAVFIDGCFWHNCPDHGSLPKSNAVWWADKIGRNVSRDRHTDEVLRSHGWTVIRVWAHEPAIDACDRVIAAIREASQPRSRPVRGGG